MPGFVRSAIRGRKGPTPQWLVVPDHFLSPSRRYDSFVWIAPGKFKAANRNIQLP